MINRIGQQLGNYQLLRLLGYGGFAQVYLGKHVLLGTRAAIKVLDDWDGSDEEFSALQREARVVAALQHEHIVRVLDFSMFDGTPFLVMEYAPHGTLAKHHPRGTRLPPLAVLPYVRQIASALQFAHDHKVIHLDVKPANMLIAHNHSILLSDFGISQAALSTPSTPNPHVSRIVGTPPYMAPEQLRGHPVMASDQFSLCVVLYEWLSGYTSFPGSPSALNNHHSYTPPTALVGRVRDVTPLIDSVLQRALSEYPQHRFASVQDFADAYEDAVRQSLRSPGAFVVGPAPFQTSAPSPFSATQRAPGVGSTVPASSAGATSSPRSNSGVPEHPLVQQERSLIQHARSVKQEYERRSVEILQNQRQGEQIAQAEQRQALQEADKDVQALHQVVDEVRDDLHTAGWGYWVQLRHFMPHPDEPARSNDPATQFREYWTTAQAAKERIISLLHRFRSPASTSKALAPVALGLTLVFGLILFAISSSPNRILADLIGMLVMFCSLLATFFIALLYALKKAYATLDYAEKLTETAHRQRVRNIEERFRERNNMVRQHFEQRKLDLDHALQAQLAELRKSHEAFCAAAGDSAAPWSDERWTSRSVWSDAPPVARIGLLDLHPFYGLPPLPILVSSPRGENVLMKTSMTSRQATIQAVQAFILRLLATQSPGRVRFTIIDPTELGAILSPFLPLAGEHESLSIDTVAIDSKEIEQQLHQVFEHIRRVNNYNAQTSGYLAPLPDEAHVVVVMGFPAKFTQDAASDLLTIIRHGPRYGVSTIIVEDMAMPLPTTGGFDVAAFEQFCHVIEWRGEQFIWRDRDFSQGRFTFDSLPPSSLADHLLQATRQQLTESASLEHNIPLQELLKEPRWSAQPAQSVQSAQPSTASTAGTTGTTGTAGTIAWLGRSTSRQAPTSVTFLPESGSHLLMLGRQEETALGLSVAASISLAAHRAPRDLRLYVVDTSPKQDIASQLVRVLPQHVQRVVARQQLHTGLSQVVTELHDLLQQRRISTSEHEADIYLLLHGLHRIDDMRAPGASFAETLATLVRQGPEVGIHLIVWCDLPNSLKNALGDDIHAYFDCRVSFEYALSGRAVAQEGGAFAGTRFTSSTASAKLFDATKEQPEPFRPYAVPTQEWLQAAAAQIARKTS